MRDYNVNKKCNICGISFPSNRNYYRTDGISACRQCGSYFLKADEKDFLKCFGINEKYVFDISRMKQKEWQSNMWIANKFIGSGSRPCRKNGHTIKLLSGHCPQCRTDSLGFTLNYFEKNLFI